VHSCEEEEMKNSWSGRVWPGPSTTDPAHVIKCNQKNNAEMICIEIYNLSLRVAAAVQETALPRVDEKETERLKERERRANHKKGKERKRKRKKKLVMLINTVLHASTTSSLLRR